MIEIYSKKNTQLEILFSLYFTIEFLREGFLYIHPFFINSISLLISLLLIYTAKMKVSKKGVLLFFPLVLFILLAFLKGRAIGFSDNRSLIYSIFKITEYITLLLVLTTISKESFINVLILIILSFIKINIVLLFYYFGALLRIFPSISRIVIFDYRFAGLAGEPAQFAQHSVFIIFSMFIVSRNLYPRNFKKDIILVVFMMILSFSNTIAILSIFLLGFYFLFMETRKLGRKLVTLLGLTPILYLMITKVFTRLEIDLDAISKIISNFSILSEYASKSSSLTGGNALSIRFFEFMYSLSLIKEPIANGFGTTVTYGRFAGYLANDSFWNMYGITQVGFELGVIPMFILIIFLLWYLFFGSRKFTKYIRLLVATIFFMIMIMNGFGFKFVWLFLFVTIIHPKWFYREEIKCK